MSFQKYKSDSFCVGGRHRSSTKNIYGDITSEGSKVLIGYCSSGNRKKLMTVKDNTKKAGGSGDFFKNQGKKGLNVSKKMAKNVLRSQDELWKLEQTLVVQLHHGALKKLYQAHLK